MFVNLSPALDRNDAELRPEQVRRHRMRQEEYIIGHAIRLSPFKSFAFAELVLGPSSQRSGKRRAKSNSAHLYIFHASKIAVFENLHGIGDMRLVATKLQRLAIFTAMTNEVSLVS